MMVGTPSELESHLADEDLDLYAARLLPDARLKAFEEHYLECPACLRRVQDLERLVAGLASLPARPASRLSLPLLAAAGFAAISFGLYRQTRELDERLARAEAQRVAPPRIEAPVAERGWARLQLAPPVRGPSLPTLAVAPGIGQVLLEVDASEVAAPGRAAEVALLAEDGGELARFRRLAFSTDGTLVVAVPGAMLPPGEYSVVVRGGAEPLQVPFRVRR